MSFLRRFLSRRWLLALVGIAAILFGVAMLHSYPRQSLFGPTIRGKPWCYWEEEVRWHATKHRQDAKRNSVIAKIKEWLGIRREGWWERRLVDHEEMLPLLLELAKDDDKDVQAFAIGAIVTYEKLYQRPALPVLRSQMLEPDLSTQIYAAKGAWRISKDKKVVPVVFEVLSIPKALRLARPATASSYRQMALSLLAEISRDFPEHFSDVVGFATDDDPGLRYAVMKEMPGFGKEGIPILRKGLDDPDEWVCLGAASLLRTMGTAKKELVGALERLRASENPDVCERAVKELIAFDPERFAHLKKD